MGEGGFLSGAFGGLVDLGKTAISTIFGKNERQAQVQQQAESNRLAIMIGEEKFKFMMVAAVAAVGLALLIRRSRAS